MAKEISELSSTEKHNYGYDVVRIIAILMVFYNHREAYEYYQHLNVGSVSYYIAQVISALIKCGPALFFMLSGALVLKKKESFKKVFTHRILRILIVMIVLSILMFFTTSYGLNVIELFFHGLNWYLYSYLGFLLMLPFLQKIACDMSIHDCKIFFWIAVAAYSINGMLIPFAFTENITGSMQLFNSSWASGCWNLTFPVIGYSLVYINENQSREENRKMSIWLFLAAVVCLMICSFLMDYDVRINAGANLEQIRQHSNLIPCSFVFFSIYNLFKEKEDVKYGKVLQLLAGTTFGMFLLDTHTIMSNRIFDFVCRLGIINIRYFCSIISIVFQFVTYFVIVWLLKKIPYVKKVL